MKNFYFISYTYNNSGISGNGNIEIDLSKKITRIDHVRLVEKYIKDKCNMDNVVINNFIFLREE